MPHCEQGHVFGGEGIEMEQADSQDRAEDRKGHPYAGTANRFGFLTGECESDGGCDADSHKGYQEGAVFRFKDGDVDGDGRNGKRAMDPAIKKPKAL